MFNIILYLLHFLTLFVFLDAVVVLIFNPNRWLGLCRLCLIVERIVCLILEGVTGYVERIRQARCLQTNER